MEANAIQTERASHVFAPIVVNRPPRATGSTVKVVGFNARGGGRIRSIVARLQRPPLAAADLILLCEADWRRRRSAGLEFASELAAILEMSFAFVPEFGIAREPADATAFMGNAILSSQPLTDVYAVPLPNPFLRKKIRRLSGGPAGLVATTILDRMAITVAVAHLNSRGAPSGREWQMREFLARIPANGPAVIGGDFNTTTISIGEVPPILTVMRYLLRNPRRFRQPERWEPLFRRLAESRFEVRGANAPGVPTFTFARMVPPALRPKLDWIALRGLAPVPGSGAVVAARASWLGRRFSDHDFVTCEISR